MKNTAKKTADESNDSAVRIRVCMLINLSTKLKFVFQLPDSVNGEIGAHAQSRVVLVVLLALNSAGVFAKFPDEDASVPRWKQENATLKTVKVRRLFSK